MTTSSPPVIRRLKYEMCKNWREKGACKYGDKCLFAHGEAELTKRSSAPHAEAEKHKPEPTTEPKESEKTIEKEELKVNSCTTSVRASNYFSIHGTIAGGLVDAKSSLAIEFLQ